MPNRLLQLSRMWFVGGILIAFPVMADAPTPSQEFWEYMADYGDDNGEVLDPLEYDQILSMKESELKENDVAGEPATVDNPKVRNADMKFEKKSSVQASSADAKGAKL